MPIVNDGTKVALALAGARSVMARAQSLQRLSGAVSFGVLRDTIDQMNRAYTDMVVPLTSAYTAQQIQDGAERRFVGVPADVRALMLGVGAALAQFNTAYGTLYAGAGNVMSFDDASGQHTFITVEVSALGSLATPLAAVVAACALLAYED